MSSPASLACAAGPQSRLGALDEQWQFLVNKSAEKSQKLKEANKQQNFNTGIKDFDFWLSEVKMRTSTSGGTPVSRPSANPCGGLRSSGGSSAGL